MRRCRSNGESCNVIDNEAEIEPGAVFYPVAACFTIAEAEKIAAALNDTPKAAPLAAFALMCIERLAVEGAAPLSPHALCEDSDEETYQERARKLIARPLSRVRMSAAARANRPDFADDRSAGG